MADRGYVHSACVDKLRPSTELQRISTSCQRVGEPQPRGIREMCTHSGQTSSGTTRTRFSILEPNYYSVAYCTTLLEEPAGSARYPGMARRCTPPMTKTTCRKEPLHSCRISLWCSRTLAISVTTCVPPRPYSTIRILSRTRLLHCTVALSASP